MEREKKKTDEILGTQRSSLDGKQMADFVLRMAGEQWLWTSAKCVKWGGDSGGKG